MANFAGISLSLSKSNRQVVFNPMLTLHENFVAMCPLPFYKKPSEETKELEALLKVCSLHSMQPGSLTKEYVTKDIAQLRLILLTLEDWEIKRKNSSRKELVKIFSKQIETQLKMVVVRYQDLLTEHKPTYSMLAPSEDGSVHLDPSCQLRSAKIILGRNQTLSFLDQSEFSDRKFFEANLSLDQLKYYNKRYYHFDKTKTMQENFDAMFFYAETNKATEKLKNVIKHTKLSFKAETSNQDINQLELVKFAIEKWKEFTDKKDHKYVAKFHQEIVDQQQWLMSKNYEAKVSPRKQLTSYAAMLFAPKAKSATNQDPKDLSSNPKKRMNFSSAIFLPILNFFMDFDCFDMVFDGVNIGLDMARMI